MNTKAESDVEFRKPQAEVPVEKLKIVGVFMHLFH